MKSHNVKSDIAMQNATNAPDGEIRFHIVVAATTRDAIPYGGMTFRNAGYETSAQGRIIASNFDALN